MAKHIVIAVTNDLVTDQRVARIAESLHWAGYTITLVGRKLHNSTSVTRVYNIKRFNLWFNKGPLFYANYNVRLFFYLLFKSFDAVLANDLDTLLACFCASKVRRKKIVYDSHEYFTEVPELVLRKVQQKAWLTIERFVVTKINYAYTVCQSIANAYNTIYNTQFKVIRNLPTKKELVHIQTEKIIMYQGALNVGRGIELMIKSMAFIDDYVLWIAGSGDIEKDLQKLVKELQMDDKVKFLGRIPLDELHTITSKAQLGLSFEEDLGLNYRYALPNKLFDYIQAQIPVLVSDLPEMKALVLNYKVGEILQNREPESVANQILNMLQNTEEKKQYKLQLKKASSELCWENEKMKLLPIFDEVFAEK